MKKTQRIVLARNIWATKVSFFSITLFVALGIAIFLGIKWNEPSFHYTVDKYYEEYEYHDFAVKFPYGITKEDIETLGALDAVTLTEGGYTADGTLRLGDDYLILVILSLTDRIDRATVVEGVMPSAANEVGIEQRMAENTGLKVGDTLIIKSRRGAANSLHSQEFIITALVEHPAYINLQTTLSRGITLLGDGELDYYVLMSEAAFNKDAYGGCFSSVYIRSNALRGLNTLSDEYKAAAVSVAEMLEAIGNERGASQYEATVLRYETELASAERELADAEREFADAEKKLADGEGELKSAEKLIGDSEVKIAHGWQKLAESEKAYASGQTSYRAGKRRLADSKAQLQDALQTLNDRIGEGFDYITTGAELTAEQKAEVVEVFEQFGIDPDAVVSTDPATARGQLAQLAGRLNDLENYLTARQDEMSGLLAQIDAYQAMADGTEEKQEALTALEAALADMNIDHTDIDAARVTAAAWLGVVELLQDGLSQPVASLSAPLPEMLNDFVGNLDTYLAGETALQNTRKQLKAASAQIENGKAELKKSEIELENAKAELEDGKRELEDGKRELESNRIKLKDAKKELQDAREAFANMLRYDRWTVEKRVDNVSYGVTDSYSGSGQKLCYSLSMLFVFVGVMICYTAVSRIVRERQVQTGVQKALGFTRREITSQYMTYAVIAVVIGSILGAALGYFVIESVMNRSFEPSYIVGAFKKHFSAVDWLLISGAELVLICFATWLACYKQLSRRALDLITGNDQTVRRTRIYEKTRWWKHSSLYTQTTVNNLVNDRTRVIATLVGVAGCTALIIMAFSFQASVVNTPEMHFSDVSVYDRRLVSDDSVEGAMSSLEEVLDAEGVSYTQVWQKLFFIEDTNGELDRTDVVVTFGPESIGEYIRFNDPSSGKPLTLPRQGVFVSNTYTLYHDISVGGTLKLLGMDGQYYSFTVAGIIEHYLPTNQIFMSAEYYESIVGEKPVGNAFYINLNGTDPEALKEKLAATEGYFSISDDHVKWSALFATYQKTTKKMVGISLFLSAVMALLVLLNLNVVLINERVKELIVMRINGFSVSAVKKYIYRDNIALTALGTLLGVGLGILLAVFVITSLSIEGSNLSTKPNLLACLAGVAITVVFTLITNLIALRRIDKLSVSDLNKQ